MWQRNKELISWPSVFFLPEDSEQLYHYGEGDCNGEPFVLEDAMIQLRLVILVEEVIRIYLWLCILRSLCPFLSLFVPAIESYVESRRK